MSILCSEVVFYQDGAKVGHKIFTTIMRDQCAELGMGFDVCEGMDALCLFTVPVFISSAFP